LINLYIIYTTKLGGYIVNIANKRIAILSLNQHLFHRIEHSFDLVDSNLGYLGIKELYGPLHIYFLSILNV